MRIGNELKMLVSGIKSRPSYPGLKVDPFAKQNVIVADDAGASAVDEMLQRSDATFANRTTLLLISHKKASPASANVCRAVWHLPTIETGMVRLSGVLKNAHMGLRLYAAGTEPLIGAVVKVAIENGIEHNSIITEHRGSTKRRVQCVHCKGITEDVTTNPVTCAHCGTALLVRDHYSRRHAAFMGVRIDAECPGEIPNSMGEFR